MVGSLMAWDMKLRGYEVTVVDHRPAALDAVKSRCEVEVALADLSDQTVLAAAVAPHDIVLGALASHMGFQTLQTVIEARKPYVDISFMEQDAAALDGLARQRGVTAVVDCGVCPGISNVIAGWAASAMDPCERIDFLVGGLPAVRHWPFEYKAPFSPQDVIEIYVRPARLVEHGKLVVKEALSEPELVQLPGIGTLEAFNTDGLRSMAQTMRAPFMREKTLRYPGHIGLMRIFREAGFFDSKPIDVNGTSVAPLDLTSKLLFSKWAFEEGEEDLTVLRVVIEGKEGARRLRRVWDLLDRYDPVTRFRSMSRTTGFPATTAADLLARGVFTEPGVHPPEIMGRRPGIAARFLGDLAERGVRFVETVEELPG